MPADIQPTDNGYRIGDLEILFGNAVKGQLLRANSLVLHGPRKIVVDPAAQPERHKGFAAENALIFYTHYHADHRAAEGVYPAETEVWASAPDAPAISDMDEFVGRVESTSGSILQKQIKMLQQVFKIGPRPVARKVNDGELIELGGCTAKLMALPGHTPGHAGLFFPEQSLLFITDIDLTSFGPWYGNDASDIRQFRQSIARARDFKCDYYFTSHGEEVLGRDQFLEKIAAFDAHFERRDRLILEALASGEKRLDDMLRMEVVYRTKTLAVMEHLIHFERKHVKKHLELLVEAGKVASDPKFESFRLAA